MSNSTEGPPMFVDNPIILNIASSYGAILIGIFFSSILYGISSLQSFIYSMNSDADSTGLRLLVLILWLADTGNQILLYAGAWPVLVKQYGRIAGLSDIQPAIMHHVWVSQPNALTDRYGPLKHIVIFTVQMYLARRIYIFCQAGAKSRQVLVAFFLGLIALLASFELVGVTVYEIKGYGKPLATLSSHEEVSINIALRATAAFVDVSIALGMVYLLRMTTPKFKRSKQLLQRLLVVTVSSGTLTAVAALLVLLTVAKLPNDLWYTMFDFPLCSLYFNTLLVNLNARSYIKNSPGVNTFSNIDSTGTGQNSTLVIRAMDSQNSSRFIKVQQETDIKMDEMPSYKSVA